MNRWPDWWAQAQRDVQHAKNARDAGDWEWSAFAAQQGAEKAVKALVMAHGGEPWGHSVTTLVESLPKDIQAEPVVLQAAQRLDKHYITTRYPNGIPAGYPGKLYTAGEAEDAISDAEEIMQHVKDHLPES